MTSIFRIIDARVCAIQAEHPDWPCRKGCDTCCRRLATVPELTAPELELLAEGIDSLPPDTQSEVLSRLEQLSPAPPVVCPFLNRDEGACLVYEYRPAACRTYGFYVERDKGLYCDIIREAEYRDVVWGNHATVERELDKLGPRSPVTKVIGPRG